MHTRDSDKPVVLRLVTRTPDLILARPDWGIQYQLPGSEADSLFTLPQPAPEPAAEPAGGAPAPDDTTTGRACQNLTAAP